MDPVAAVREDIVDGLTSGTLAEEADAFHIEVQDDGSVLATYGTDTFRVTVERLSAAE